ncbi:GNAT family N-acetyltransferase [[Kitasatospora] papulosa]|uniref:GNAT family N-acetyltransferase n=1 Tax=[Kitasatospora] papulosa TaxID=1464011 RepID=UPI00367927DD
MTTEQYDQIERVPQWPARAEHDVFQSRGWTRSLEDSLGERRRYLLHRDGEGTPRGSATCYFVSPQINPFLNPSALIGHYLQDDRLSAFLTPEEEEEAARIAKQNAGLLDTSAVSTAPFGFTQSICHDDDVSTLDSLLQGVEDARDEWGAGAAAVLYVREQDTALRSALRSKGYAEALVGANCVLPVTWDSFEGYLDIYGPGRQRRVTRERNSFLESGISVSIEPVEPNLDEIARLQALLQQKYGAGYHPDHERRVFASVVEHLSPYANLLVARRDGRLVAFTMFFEKDGVMYSKMASRDSELTDPSEYVHYNMCYYELAAEAARRGAREIHYGHEAYAAKLHRGCELRPLFWYTKVSGPDHALLERASSLVSKATSSRLEDIRSVYQGRANFRRTPGS